MIKKILLITTILGIPYASVILNVHKGLDHGNTQQNKRPYPAEKHIRVKQRKTQGSDMKKQKEVLAIIDGKAIYEISSFNDAMRLSEKLWIYPAYNKITPVAAQCKQITALFAYAKMHLNDEPTDLMPHLYRNISWLIRSISESKEPELKRIAESVSTELFRKCLECEQMYSDGY